MKVGTNVTFRFNPNLKGIIIKVKEDLKRAKVEWTEGTNIQYTCHNFNDLIPI